MTIAIVSPDFPLQYEPEPILVSVVIFTNLSPWLSSLHLPSAVNMRANNTIQSSRGINDFNRKTPFQ